MTRVRIPHDFGKTRTTADEMKITAQITADKCGLISAKNKDSQIGTHGTL
jgi:hypothetical protein